MNSMSHEKLQCVASMGLKIHKIVYFCHFWAYNGFIERSYKFGLSCHLTAVEASRTALTANAVN